jgi:hypothetical protein
MPALEDHCHQTGELSDACFRFPSITSFRLLLTIALSPSRGRRG